MKPSSENILEHIRNLSFPRRTGSEGEERAISYILHFFKTHSLEAEIQEFGFSTFAISVLSKVIPLLIPVFVILSALLAESLPLISCVLLLLVLYIFFVSTRWSWLAERIAGCRGTKKAKNIIARISSENADKEVVFLAHYDSKSQTIPIFVRIISLIIFLILVVISITLILLKASGSVIIERDFMLYLNLVAIVFTFPYFLNINRNKSPGALDNASGVGIMLELARLIKGSSRPGMPSFTFVATGAEEEGLIGSINFMKRYSETFKTRKTFFINFDSAGAPGKISLIDRCGMPARKCSEELAGSLMKTAQERGIHLVRGGLPPGTGVDSFPISYRGFDSITFSSGKLSRAVLSLHSTQDTLRNISVDSIEKVAELALGIILKLKGSRY